MGKKCASLANEAEITPEMIEVGAMALVRAIAPSRLYAPMTFEAAAKSVFEAMDRRRPSSPKCREHD